MASIPDTRTLLSALDEPALLVESGRVLAANDAATALLGRGIEGRDLRLAIRHPAALERILAGVSGDLDITGIGTADRPWLLTVRPLGRNMVLARLLDRSAARAAEKMRVDFVANASHELRTPLTTILGYSETLAEDGDLGPETCAKFGGIMRGEARRMLRIVEDLMSLSRIEADRFVPPQEKVSIDDIIELSAAHGRELADQSNCRIEVETEPGLPPVIGDFAQLLQMTDNLVSNAVRYGCAERSCTVRIGARPVPGGVQISVADEGAGIAPEHLPRLTQRFYRIDETRSRDSGGTGLGLAIVKHIVERHRATMDIRSRPGNGTEVRVRLPLG